MDDGHDQTDVEAVRQTIVGAHDRPIDREVNHCSRVVNGTLSDSVRHVGKRVAGDRREPDVLLHERQVPLVPTVGDGLLDERQAHGKRRGLARHRESEVRTTEFGQVDQPDQGVSRREHRAKGCPAHGVRRLRSGIRRARLTSEALEPAS